MNIRLLIEYDGTDFAGWQRQPHKPTIQGSIEAVLKKISKKKIPLYGAGRTDSGVHAWGQVANFSSDGKETPETWKKILNHYLPPTIRILESAQVPEKFHAQKDAIEKVYEYVVLNRKVPSALARSSYFFPRPLDWDRIRQAAKDLVGTHDFRSFQGARASVKTTVRRVRWLEIVDQGDGFYVIRICANGFLKQMVRSIVGTLLAIGEGRMPADGIQSMLAQRDRRAGGPTAPAHGLFLVKVVYPEWAVRDPLCPGQLD